MSTPTTASPAASSKPVAAGVERFKNITLGGRSASSPGELIVTGDNDEKCFYWKATTSASTVSVKKDSIDRFEWVFTTRGYTLRILKKGEEPTTEFNNFKDTDFTRLGEVFEQYFSGIDFKRTDIGTRGVNWGDARFNGSSFLFDVDGAEQFSFPSSEVKNIQKNKNEIVIEFQDDDTAQKTDDVLVEVRFVLPSSEETNESASASAFDALQRLVQSKGGDTSEKGDAIASFEGLPFVTPRGKYNVDLHKKYIRLHGKSYSFKILYKSISTLFLLPKPGGQHMYFVVSLDTPVRQGQKAYYHLVFQFDKSSVIKKEKPLILNMEPAELQSYADKGLKKEMEGKVFEIVAKVFRALAERKLIGAGKFNSFSGDNAIKCSMKANEGFLFFLEKSLFFLHKPAIYMRHEEIKNFKFARAGNSGSGSRYFDLMVILKNGKTWNFSNINKNEYDNLVHFISGKNLPIENLKEMQEQAEAANLADIMGDGDDDSEDDENFNPEAHDSDEDDREFEEFTTAKANDHHQNDNDNDAGDQDMKEVSEKPKKEAKKRKREEDDEKPKKKKKKSEDGGEEKKKKKKKSEDGGEEKKKKKKKDGDEKPKKKKKEDGEKKKKKSEDGEEKTKKKKKKADKEE